MQPRGGESPQFESPAFLPGEQGVDSDEAKQETLVSSPESSPAKQGPAPVVAIPQIPTADSVAVGLPADDDSDAAAPPSAHSTAVSDKIDKKWLERAQKVINQTKDDPYKQKNEVSKVKAEYISTRYNKKLKVDEG